MANTKFLNAGLSVKICGLTRFEDAELAVSLGAWALGFIFFKKSPRFVTSECVRDILKNFKNDSFRRVGVFVDAPLAAVTSTMQKTGIDTVQLHGNESAEYCLSLREAVPKIFIIKALRLKKSEEISSLQNYQACEALLLDTYVEGTLGGTGVANNFDLIREAKMANPRQKIILSGGLQPENIIHALQTVRPVAVDISSGVESSTGIKDHNRMKVFFEKVKSFK